MDPSQPATPPQPPKEEPTDPAPEQLPPIEDQYKVIDTPPVDVNLKIEENRNKRHKATILSGAIIGLGILLIMFLTAAGLSTSTYAEASSYSGTANTVAFLLALTAGIYTAYITAHPTRLSTQVKKKNDANVIVIAALVALGLFLGVIPGLIILALYFLLFRRKVDRPVTSKDPNNSKPTMSLQVVNFGFIVVGFILGFIPALILAFILTYPLGKHACELSGSKYC